MGRAAELRELQTRLDPDRGDWQAAVIHGLGGMGKTVLAHRLAERMAPRLQGVKSMRTTPTTTARGVLDQLGGSCCSTTPASTCPRSASSTPASTSPCPCQTKPAC